MDLEPLDAVTAVLTAHLGDALLALDITDADSGLSLRRVRLSPAVGPMLQRITSDLRQAAVTAGTSATGYHVMSVADTLVALVDGEVAQVAFVVPNDTDLDLVIGEVIPAVAAVVARARV